MAVFKIGMTEREFLNSTLVRLFNLFSVYSNEVEDKGEVRSQDDALTSLDKYL